MCAAVFACTDTAFVGLYAILPQFQGQGLGLELWTLCMQHVGNRNAGLYAVPSQVSTYRDKAGFRCEDSCKMLVYDGDAPLDSSKLVQVLPNVQLCHFDETLEDAVAAYDQGVVGYDRKLLLHETLREPDSLTLVAKGKLDNGSVVGYASFRTNNIGKCMVGPLYADNDAIAEFLVTTALASFGAAQSHGVLFMPLDGNSGGVTIATKLGLELHEDLPRFFTKHIPSASMDKIYCVHTPNFSPF
ncbi:hypothetical protein HDE_12662 [Halotydeus destructor]|nr:hypothetical protein HDE_12662 [Halotydeus destructor]